MTDNSISDLSYPLDGVTIHQLNEFVDDCGGRSAFDGKTTTDVNNEIQKPITLNKKVSYCDFLKEKDALSVKKANVFISHAWKQFSRCSGCNQSTL
jgi:hypothetical protein